jgi:hypothetical protein
MIPPWGRDRINVLAPRPPARPINNQLKIFIASFLRTLPEIGGGLVGTSRLVAV